MALTDKLNTAYAELTQAQKVAHARALIQPIREDIIRINFELQEIADSGSFDTVDIEIKQALIAAWNVLKTAKTGFENVTIKELLDWRPE